MNLISLVYMNYKGKNVHHFHVDKELYLSKINIRWELSSGGSLHSQMDGSLHWKALVGRLCKG